MVLIISHALCASNALFASCASFTSRLTRAAAVFGGFLMVAYHKSSAAKASHVAGAGGWKTKTAGLVLFLLQSVFAFDFIFINFRTPTNSRGNRQGWPPISGTPA